VEATAVPRRIADADEFLKLAEQARECRVKRLEGEVKLKLRTRKYLYTLSTSPADAEALLKKIKCPIKEF